MTSMTYKKEENSRKKRERPKNITGKATYIRIFGKNNYQKRILGRNCIMAFFATHVTITHSIITSTNVKKSYINSS